jgi:histidyl-tRNA synthetase
VYVVHQGSTAATLAFRSAERLRDAGIDVILHCGGGSFKSQFKKADASGATLALVIGEDEAARDQAALKWLRRAEGPGGAEGGKSFGEQVTVALADLPRVVLDALYQPED